MEAKDKRGFAPLPRQLPSRRSGSVQAEGGEYVIEGYTNSEADALVEADDWAELAGTGRGYDDS